MQQRTILLLLVLVVLNVHAFSQFHITVSKQGSAEISMQAHSQAHIDMLRDQGYTVREDYKQSSAWKNYLQANEQSNGTFVYHHYDELTAYLQNITQACSDIASISTVGKSVQGRELWYIKFAVNGSSMPKPAFKYIANMHGDETVGREMLLHLATYLCDKSKGDDAESQRVKNYLSQMDVYLMPSMNPDGFELNQRYNAHDVDLNRNFPDQFKNPNNTLDGKEPEVQHVMNWLAAHNTPDSTLPKFILSANMHGGEELANYPYDGLPDLYDGPGNFSICPDDTTYHTISLAYALNDPDMKFNPRFKNGVTNGAFWWAVYGGMQDYNYVYRECFEITLELSMVKYPPVGTLPEYWNKNLEAMLQYMEQAYLGVKGIIVDAKTKEPLQATISIDGIAYNVTSNKNNGVYYRVLAADYTLGNQTYMVTVSAPGYQSQSKPVTIFNSQKEMIVLNFDMHVSQGMPVVMIVLACVFGAAVVIATVAVIIINVYPSIKERLRRKDYEQAK